MKKREEVWRKITQDYCKFIIPDRPSVDDTRNYATAINQALKNKKEPKILVMGSTPEIRRFLFTYTCLFKAQVYCVDFSSDMYKAMTDFINKSKLKEKYIKASWLKTGLKNNFFDLVVGDEVICNIEPKKHKELFQEISRILKKDGHWVTRHNMHLPNQSKPKTIILNIVKDLKQKKYSFQEAIHYLFISLFYSLVTTNKKYRLNQAEQVKEMRKVYKILKNDFDKKVLKELIKHFQENWQSTYTYYWYVLSKKDSERELREFFTIKKILTSRDYITVKNSPIYLLKNKKD